MRPFAVTLPLLQLAIVSTPLAAQTRDCRPTFTPQEFPAASALVDSARAIADLAAFSRTDRPMVFSLVFNEDDSLPTVRPLDKTDAIAAVFVLRALRPQPPSETWAIRLRVQGGNSPAVTLERSIYCPPAPDSLKPILITNVTAADVEKSDRVPIENLGIKSFEALVSAEGKALEIRLVGSTGIAEADREVMQDLKQRHYEPALLDGLPMQAVYRWNGKSPRL